jgi:hypothetical protein
MFFYRLHKSVFLILTENKLPTSQLYHLMYSAATCILSDPVIAFSLIVFSLGKLIYVYILIKTSLYKNILPFFMRF